MKILVTGGAGFIGSALVRHLVVQPRTEVVNVDMLTYAGNLSSLESVEDAPNYRFEQADIRDFEEVARIFGEHRPDAVAHLAAESHVDRSIDGADDFISTNINGTYALLEVARLYWRELDDARKARFRFLHVSTDEVYGELGPAGSFSEASPAAPNSPYAASKAASDHLVRAWYRTYGLPTLITNCSNNYGPYQFPEKLIPLTTINALEGRQLPVYGDGKNVRDWLHVQDHVEILTRLLREGRAGERYNIGGDAEVKNLDVVRAICSLMDELAPKAHPHADLIDFVADRPGHDFRYAIDATKVREEMRWRPERSFESGLRETVVWYLDNRTWWERVRDGRYRAERLGLGDGETTRRIA